MNLVTRVLQSNEEDRTRMQIIGWWERRRIVYNAILLLAGAFTLLIGYLLGQLTFTDVNDFLPPLLLFAVSANLFYTLGWLVEIFCTKMISQKELVQKAGPILFIAGTCFSLFVTFTIDVAIFFSYFFTVSGTSS